MTTDEATTELAARWRDCDDESTAGRALHDALDAGRRWRWDEAADALTRAYRALGAEPPPDGGYAWHTGTHPIQLARS